MDGFSRKAIEVNVIELLVTTLTTFQHLKILYEWNIKEKDIKKMMDELNKQVRFLGMKKAIELLYVFS